MYAYSMFDKIPIVIDTKSGNRVFPLQFAQAPKSGEATNCPKLYAATTHPKNDASLDLSTWKTWK